MSSNVVASNQHITWTTETRFLSDLIPWPRNPRQIRQPEAKRLAESFDQFGQVETLAIGPGNEVYNGHQRLNVLAAEHGLDYVVDVRVASRALTEKEREKLTVYLHKGAAGEWNFDELANWDMPDLMEWGFNERDLGIETVASPTEDDWMAAFDGTAPDKEKTVVHIAFNIPMNRVDDLNRLLARYDKSKDVAFLKWMDECLS